MNHSPSHSPWKAVPSPPPRPAEPVLESNRQTIPVVSLEPSGPAPLLSALGNSGRTAPGLYGGRNGCPQRRSQRFHINEGCVAPRALQPPASGGHPLRPPRPQLALMSPAALFPPLDTKAMPLIHRPRYPHPPRGPLPPRSPRLPFGPLNPPPVVANAVCFPVSSALRTHRERANPLSPPLSICMLVPSHSPIDVDSAPPNPIGKKKKKKKKLRRVPWCSVG
jgi:hypothetical protein